MAVARRRRNAASRTGEELAAHGVPPSIQHDDLHMGNVYERGGRLRDHLAAPDQAAFDVPFAGVLHSAVQLAER